MYAQHCWTSLNGWQEVISKLHVCHHPLLAEVWYKQWQFYTWLLEFKHVDLGKKYEVYRGLKLVGFNCDHISSQTLNSVDNILCYEEIADIVLIVPCRYWPFHKFDNLRLLFSSIAIRIYVRFRTCYTYFRQLGINLWTWGTYISLKTTKEQPVS